MIYFTADTHFWHYNIIEYSNRPIWYDDNVLGPPIPNWMDGNTACVGMNELIVRRWNEIVHPHDEVYILGDIFWCGVDKAHSILDKLNGIKYWIRGNHDVLANKASIVSHFEWVRDYYLLKVHDVYQDEEDETKFQQYHQPIVLSHFPFLSWDGLAHGTWHLHGHCHGTLPKTRSMRLDVGVDTNNMFPYSYEEIKKIMVMRSVVPVDGHGL